MSKSQKNVTVVYIILSPSAQAPKGYGKCVCVCVCVYVCVTVCVSYTSLHAPLTAFIQLNGTGFTLKSENADFSDRFFQKLFVFVFFSVHALI